MPPARDESGQAGPESGSRAEPVVIGTLALAALYAALTPMHLLALSGVPRTVMTLLAATSAALCAAMWWRTRHLDRFHHASSVDRYLLAMCLVPLVNSLTHLGVTGQLEQTTVLMLSVVGVASVNPHRRHVVPLFAAAVAVWAVLVWWTDPEPRSQTVHYAIQLGLAVALGCALFVIRARVADRLATARRELATQLADAVRLRNTVTASEQRFRSVFEDSPVAIALSDEQGHFVEVNDALCELLGRPTEGVLGRSAAEFTHPDDLATQQKAGPLIEAAPDGVATLEKRYVRPGGDVRWVWLTLRHVLGPTGETYTLAHVQDVTVRKADEEKLRQSREAMATTAEIASASQRSVDVRPVAVDAARRFCRARAAAVLELTRPGVLSATAASGQDNLLGIEVDLAEPSMTADVWTTSRPMFISHATNHPMVNQRLLQLVGGDSLMWHPVMVGEEMRALMVVFWDESDIEESDHRREAVGMVATELSSALMAADMRLQLEEATVTDPLTGLLNRRGWKRQMQELVAHSERSLRPFTIALVDLDHFKLFNDTHGHDRGDQALTSFARAVTEALRAVDVIARWGGEEFVVALRDTDAEQAEEVLERLRASTAGELTCSIGYCTVPPGGSPDRGLVAADRALYAAKGGGRNQIHQAAAPTARISSGG